MLPIGLLIWIVAMALTLWGLVAVLRYRIAVGALLLLMGLATGLASTAYPS
ncbi:hypothetical protein [Kribbella sancticallisti]|uniref:hypothetical protein n=1 Tax=Kribbella sancticallisti TaxID=460087 RepID=UPI0031DB999F